MIMGLVGDAMEEDGEAAEIWLRRWIGVVGTLMAIDAIA
jgi:hypothetical protein